MSRSQECASDYGLCAPAHFSTLTEAQKVPPPVNDQTTYKIEYGMDTHYVEPWLECNAKQHFNDNLKGYIHGAYTTYMMHRSSYEIYLNVGNVQLKGKYIDACPFSYNQFEIASADATVDPVKVVLAMPDYFKSQTYGQTSINWA